MQDVKLYIISAKLTEQDVKLSIISAKLTMQDVKLLSFTMQYAGC